MGRRQGEYERAVEIGKRRVMGTNGLGTSCEPEEATTHIVK